jgi:hypothetical protein
MTRYFVIRLAALCLAACSAELVPEPEPDVGEQPIMTQQGTAMDGLLLQGTQLQDKFIRGFRFSGATLNGAPLVNLRLVKGELLAEQNQVTLRGTALVNARLFAEAYNRNVHPPQTINVEYEITGIVAEDPIYDPTGTGNTYLYTLSQNVDNTGSWQPACPVDGSGRRIAIPLADTFNERGSRMPSALWFTFGCTTAVIAKCYRLGYRPWVSGYGNLAITHWTCTRLLRADYCGDGIPHTENGKLINAWDFLPPPGPILAQGPTPPGMTFEAAWDQNGALCLSHARWNKDGADLTAACSNRLRPPGQGMQVGTVCDNVAQALMMSGVAPRLFNESVIPP